MRVENTHTNTHTHTHTHSTCSQVCFPNALHRKGAARIHYYNRSPTCCPQLTHVRHIGFPWHVLHDQACASLRNTLGTR